MHNSGAALVKTDALMSNWQCLSCNHAFEEYLIPGTYGSFLVWSVSTRTMGLMKLGSAGPDSVWQAIEKDGQLKGCGSRLQADISRHVLSQLADAAPDGSRFRMSEIPLCPRCGSGVVECTKPDQGQLATIRVPEVTFNGFRQRSPGEQSFLIGQLLTEALAQR